jgi:GTP pyrophosphokinase
VHVGRVQVTLLNEPGSLGSLTTVIARNEGNISNLKITNRSMQFFDILVDIEVRDVAHLTDITAARVAWRSGSPPSLRRRASVARNGRPAW